MTGLAPAAGPRRCRMLLVSTARQRYRRGIPRGRRRPIHTLAIIIAMLLAQGLAAVPTAGQSYHDILDRYQEQDGFNGVILVADGQRLRALEGVGRADAEYGVPMLAATRFGTGSVSKRVDRRAAAGRCRHA